MPGWSLAANGTFGDNAINDELHLIAFLQEAFGLEGYDPSAEFTSAVFTKEDTTEVDLLAPPE